MDPIQFSNIAVIISVVVALTSIISPIVTTLLNNHHQQKLRVLELKEKADREHAEFVARIFENYLSKASRLIKFNYAITVQEYGLAYGSVLLYLTKEETILINQCDDLIRNEDMYNAGIALRGIAEVLRTRIQ